MGKTKFKMPSMEEFLKRKRKYKKTDPVWVYLEREMQEMDLKGVKPYNNTVGKWLTFLRELRRFFFLQSKRIQKRLEADTGPSWYRELSPAQREILFTEMTPQLKCSSSLKNTVFMQKLLTKLGIDIKFPPEMILNALDGAADDPGIFLWLLFKQYYALSPSDVLPTIVVIDMEECIAEMSKLAKIVKSEAVGEDKKPKKYYQSNMKNSPYLTKMYVPHVVNNCLAKKPLPERKLILDERIKFRTQGAYEKIIKNNEATTFQKRRQRITDKQKQCIRECRYKFWRPPYSLRCKDQKFSEKYDVFSKKLNIPKFLKQLPKCENVVCQIADVCYSTSSPVYHIANFTVTLPPGYVLIHGGIAGMNGEYYVNVLGSYNTAAVAKCESKCSCEAKWNELVDKHLKSTKRKDGHPYDYGNTGEATETYFYPPTPVTKHWIDFAKIFNLDPNEDYIKDQCKQATRTESPESSLEPVGSAMKPKELLQALLAFLSDGPLLLPHLPKVHLLNNLVEWARRRLYGKISSEEHSRLMTVSSRRWMDLERINFREKSCSIEFTKQEKSNFTYMQKPLVQSLAEALQNDFEQRNKLRQLEQARLFWPTMKHEVYPAPSFLKAYFAYMPSKMSDIHLYNPYKPQSANYPRCNCPIRVR